MFCFFIKTVVIIVIRKNGKTYINYPDKNYTEFDFKYLLSNIIKIYTFIISL